MTSGSKVLLALILTVALAVSAMAEDRLFRFPDVSADMIAFAYAGDIWTVPISGGLARKITNDPGLEIFPKFSPDGKLIAFTGQYDGNTHVYFMPSEGGEPVRLTYHPGSTDLPERMGPENIVMDWSRDGQKVLFRSRAFVMNDWVGKLYLADIRGGMPVELPIPEAGFGSFSPDETEIAYCPTFRDFRTWKRYKGGMAQDVYIYNLKTYQRKKITDWEGTDNLPMWAGDKIYFNSDRTGTLNLFVYNTKTGDARQITTFTEYDVRWPSLGPKQIIFENGGYLYLMDLATEKINKVAITLGADKINVRPEYVDVQDRILDYSLSPDGKRALFCARGEVFTSPAEKGDVRNLTNSSGINEKEPVWSPDGKYIAYLSDKTGEDEIYLIAQDGKSPAVALTNDGHCYRYGLLWSPDSKMLAFADANTNLYILDIATKNITTVDEAEKSRIYDYSWSPDSRWLAYSKTPDPTNIYVIYLYSLDQNQTHRITDGVTHDYNPVFDPEGKYLFFLSDRNYNAMLGEYEFNFIFNAATGIYAILLTKDTPSPFAPESDEVQIQKSDKVEKKDESEKKPAEKAPFRIKVDLENIADRQVAIPIQPGNYNGLSAVKGRVYYISYPFGGLSGKKGTQEQELRYFDLTKKEDKLFLSQVDGYSISADNKKILLKSGAGYFINDIESDQGDKSKGAVKLSGMNMFLDRKAEYKQIYAECWRRMRDFFYDRQMHGVDWLKMEKRYAELLPYAAHRFDLIYLVGELIGELSCSHTYFGDGDYHRPGSDNVALLGIDFQPDSAAGLYRIGKILKGENWEETLRSPLTEPGIKVKEGYFILEVDGEKLALNENPYKLFVNKAERLVRLKVSPTTNVKDAYEIEIKPISSESNLRYYNWVQGRRAVVDSLSGGKIGYIHITNMDSDGLNEFAQAFYHLYKKEGLIIDVRFNGGGFVSQLVLDRLRRVIVGMGAGRLTEVETYPSVAFHGHMACIIDEYSCSDGDIFPYYFREYKLGPLIGKRTWGGVVGFSGSRPLIDGGYLTVPVGGPYDFKGAWVMENIGVVPDIEVEQTPELVMRGHDPQLEKAVAVVMEKIKSEPLPLPPKPGPPRK